jgi:hypothetical protein
MPTLTNFPYDPLLDLAPWVGQRQATYRFNLINSVSGINQGEIKPMRGATLSHDTGRTIKRQLTISLGVAATQQINPIQDRIRVTMVFPNGQTYPLGIYMFTDEADQLFTSGELSNIVLNDEMYLVDQQIETGFNTLFSNAGQPGTATSTPISLAITNLLRALPVRLDIQAGSYATNDSWGAGTMRGSIIEALALNGDYFSPWFANDEAMHFLRAFNPAQQIPDFDWDRGNQVMRSNILRNSNILNAPNRFIVISNTPDDVSSPVFGQADVAQTAPHSIANRGFVIPKVTDLQALSKTQCVAIAQNMVERQSVFETQSLNTAPDPRHDSYNVIKWQGSLWLELAWTMTLTEGAAMSHTIRKAYV